MRIVAIILIFYVFVAGDVLATASLTLHDCIEQALANYPALKSAREGINAGKGRADQARSPHLPQVQASTGYSESHSLGGALGESTTKSYTTTLSVNQIIYDFGKTSGGFDAARSGVQSAESDAARVRQEVILNVK